MISNKLKIIECNKGHKYYSIPDDNICPECYQSDSTTENFTHWLDLTIDARHRNKQADVPCNGCTACCTSSYFIHIRPDETRTLDRIPKELLFPAPGLPKGNVLMGYNEKGHCPMFIDNKCSIYEDRPQTCRSYDCRVFPATGLYEDNKPLILQKAEQWKFTLSTKEDEKNLSAVRASAKFINEHAEKFPKGLVPKNITQQAVFAIKIYKVFLNYMDDREFLGKTEQIIKKILVVTKYSEKHKNA